MATFTWYLQGTSPTTIEATDIIQFAGSGGFDTAITVGEYNDTTHVESSVGADDSSGNTPKNNKFISQTGGGGGDSQGDWGDGTEDIDAITGAECALKINFSHGSSVITTDAVFYSYDGTTPATKAVDIDVRGAELADTNWTEIEGSGSPVTIADDTTSTSHDYYLLVSASPESVGEKTAFAFRIELTYS
jgi:hypothetical protein